MNRKAEEFALESEKAQQQKKELGETIIKLTDGAQKEKQNHKEALDQSIERAEKQREEYEQKIAQLKAKVTETEAKLTAAVNEANHRADALSLEKKRALQQNREYEENLVKVRTDAKQQQQKSVERLNQAQWDIETRDEEIKKVRKEKAKVKSRFRLSLVTLIPAIVLGMVMGHLYFRFDDDITGQQQVKNGEQRIAQNQTFSEFTEESTGLEAAEQRQGIVTTNDEALQVNQNAQIETVGVPEKMEQLQAQSQKWLEPTSDFQL